MNSPLFIGFKGCIFPRTSLRLKLPLTIGYLTVEDARDRRSWSGTHHFLLKELERRVERVELIGPLPTTFAVRFCRALNQLFLRFPGKRLNWRASPWVARSYARVIEKRLKGRHVDVIIAPAGLSTTAYLQTAAPIIYINDRCIAGAVGYHDVLQNLFEWSLQDSLETERVALRASTISIFSSDWAADAARKAVPEKTGSVRVIPFGANLPEAPATPGIGTWPNGPVKLLFLGVNWDEKGGPIAYEALLNLKRHGLKVQLVVCGCEPPPECDDPDLVCEGFLDKNRPEQLARLQEHLRTADFLILPTRFEAYGIVFCEAAAYGLPVIATRTGGIPTVVKDGVTGLLLPRERQGVAYAEAIQELIARPEALAEMRRAARERFETVLNWRAFVDELLSAYHTAKSER